MAELNDKLITYGNLSTFHDNLINDSVTSGNSTWSSEKIASEIQQGGGGGSATIENITYAQLKAKRDNSQLVKGQQYRITDYVTMVNSDTTPVSSAEHPFDLIVTAIDVNKLSETGVKVAHCANDDYFVPQPFRYYIDESDSSWAYPYEGTIEIDGTTYYKWYCADTISSHAEYILTTQATYSNTPDGEDENGEYYYTTYPFAGFLTDSEEVVGDYEGWEESHKCIIKTEEIDGTMQLIVGDVFLQESETYQTSYEPKLNAWEVKYCLDNDKSRFDWAQLANEGLGFSAIKVSGSKGMRYYIDGGAYEYFYDGTIEDNGVTYYKWYTDYTQEENWVLTTQAEFPNEPSGVDENGCTYYSNVYNVVGEITIDGESFENFYKSNKRIIMTDSSTYETPILVLGDNYNCVGDEVAPGEEGTFLYKRYASGDTQDSYAWVYVNNTNNVDINDKSVDWDNINTDDIIYTSSLTPSASTVAGDFEVVEYNSNVQYIANDGKGVVYYLKDEFNNVAEYDFKNILFATGDNIIQVEWEDGAKYLYKRYPEKDYSSYYAYVYLNQSEGCTIDDYLDDMGGFYDIDTTNVIYFATSKPQKNDEDKDDNCSVITSKYFSTGYKFTFGNISENNPADDSYQGNSNTNTIECNLIDGIKYIPVLNLVDGTRGYGVGGGTTYTAGSNISISDGVISATYRAGNNVNINNGVISAIDTKYSAGDNISIDGNEISCTYSVPKASSNTLGGVKVGTGLAIDNDGVLSMSTTNLPVASESSLGCIKVGDGLSIANSILSTDVKQEDIDSLLEIILHPELLEYPTIEALNNNTDIIFINESSPSQSGRNISVSTDKETWTTYTADSSGVTIATLNQGDKLYLKSDNVSYMTLRFSDDCYFYGDIMYLCGFPETNKNILKINNDNAFNSLFKNNTHLLNKQGKNIYLPATILPHEGCYYSMFEGCSGLTVAPNLPAINLPYDFYSYSQAGCYCKMFADCISLTETPHIKAISLSNNCCCQMFKGCTSLTTVHKLPATELAYNCYYGMFSGCTSLTSVPSDLLPAMTVSTNAYSCMFDGCTSLTTPPDLPATSLWGYAYTYMFKNCTSLTTAPDLPNVERVGNNGYMYSHMFEGCRNLNYIKCLANTYDDYWFEFKWVSGVAGTGTFVKNPSATNWVTGVNGIPSGWTVVDYVEPSAE